MAVTLDVIVPAKGDLEFDFTNKVMTAKTGIDILTAQELVNAQREAEAELLGLRFDVVANISGKVTIEGVTATGIVNEFIDWFIVSGKSTGSLIIKTGTTVKSGAGGEIFDPNNLVSQINILEVNGTVVSIGSGVTDQDKLDIADKVWAKELP